MCNMVDTSATVTIGLVIRLLLIPPGREQVHVQ
jgi:hypothetical protein